MPNPFEHDDSGASAADQRMQQQMQTDIQKREQELDEFRSPAPDTEDDIEVDLGSPERNEDEAFDLDPPEDRQDKKRTRYREAVERSEEEREKRLKAEAENAALRAIQSTQMGRPPVPSSDPLQTEIDGVYNERMRLAEQYNDKRQSGQMSDEEDKSLRAKARELEEKSQRLQYRKVQREDAQNRDPVQDRIQAIKLRNPDVAENIEAWNWADGRARMRIAKGEQYSQDLVAEVMEETRREFRLGSHRHGSPSDDRTKAAFTAPPRGSGPVQRQSGTPGRVKMTPAMRRMADAAFPGIKEPKKRYTHWARTAGRSFLEMEKGEGR